MACGVADFEDGLDGSSLGSVCLECEVGNAGVSGGDEVAWPPLPPSGFSASGTAGYPRLCALPRRSQATPFVPLNASF